MKLPQKLLLIFLMIIVFSFSPVHAQEAKMSELKIDSTLKRETQAPTKIGKIVFAKVKKLKVLNISREKYAQEVAYFFYKMGFNASPASYLIFEDGEVVSLNPNWISNSYVSNEPNPVLVLLVYENEFKLENFTKGLTTFKPIVQEIASLTEVDSADLIELASFVVERITSEAEGTTTTALNIRQKEDASALKTYFSGVNFTQKEEFNLSAVAVETSKENLEYGKTHPIKFKIKNNSKRDLMLNDLNALTVSFEKDSKFFINGEWASPKVAAVIKEGLIKANSEVEFEFKIQASLRPGSLTDEFSIKYKDKEITKSKLAVSVKDSGQKILKIKPTELNYLKIRQEAKVDSAEIGRALVGNEYEFTESSNNFYKIKFSGDKEGWVSSQYVEIVKQ